MEKRVDSVHELPTMIGGSVHHGPPSGTDQRPPERGGTLIGAWLLNTPRLKSSPVRVGRREGRTAKTVWRSPGLERRSGSQSMTANRQLWRGSKEVMLEIGEEGWRVGMTAARTGRGSRLFVGAGGRRRHRGGFNGQP
jgi:hypothetical protein